MTMFNSYVKLPEGTNKTMENPPILNGKTISISMAIFRSKLLKKYYQRVWNDGFWRVYMVVLQGGHMFFYQVGYDMWDVL
jgi:hypothetical protein